MVFHLLAAAATPITTTSTATVAGATIGGLAAGATGFWWFFSGSEKEIPPEYKASLDAQNRLTQQRIAEATQAVKSVAPGLKVVATQVKQATQATTASVSELKQTSENILQTSERLKDVVLATKKPRNSHTSAYAALKSVMQQTYQYVQETTDEISQAHRDIETLKTTLDEQAAAIASLTELVNTLTAENAQHQQTIEQQDLEIKRLKPQVAQLAAQTRFFRAAALQVLSEQGQAVSATAQPTF